MSKDYDRLAWIKENWSFFEHSRRSDVENIDAIKPAMELLLVSTVTKDPFLSELLSNRFGINPFPNLSIDNLFTSISNISSDLEIAAICYKYNNNSHILETVRKVLGLILLNYPSESFINRMRTHWALEQLCLDDQIQHHSECVFYKYPPCIYDRKSLYDLTHYVFFQSDFGNRGTNKDRTYYYIKKWIESWYDYTIDSNDVDLYYELLLVAKILNFAHSTSLKFEQSPDGSFGKVQFGLTCPDRLKHYSDAWVRYHPVLVVFLLEFWEEEDFDV